jgi:hypothetical protein
MNILSKDKLIINIIGNADHVVSTFLRVFLANERLTGKQLEITTALVSKYSEFVNNGVSEPYASTLLFSTETRKDICKDLKIGAAHLNNTFDALMKKNILGKENGKYQMNPHIVPNSTLTFKFQING